MALKIEWLDTCKGKLNGKPLINRKERESGGRRVVSPRTGASKNSKSNCHLYTNITFVTHLQPINGTSHLSRPNTTDELRQFTDTHICPLWLVTSNYISLIMQQYHACGIHASWVRHPTSTHKSHILSFTFTRYPWVIKWKSSNELNRTSWTHNPHVDDSWLPVPDQGALKMQRRLTDSDQTSYLTWEINYHLSSSTNSLRGNYSHLSKA